MGVFEGKYINIIKGNPASWKNLPKVVGPKDEADVELNYYKIKSRQPLSVWKKNGWIMTDEGGLMEICVCIHYTSVHTQISIWRSLWKMIAMLLNLEYSMIKQDLFMGD